MGYYFRTYETVLSKAQNTTTVPIVPGSLSDLHGHRRCLL